MDEKIVAVAGGSGFIGRAIVRRIESIPGIRVRLLTRNPGAARKRVGQNAPEAVRADVTDPPSLRAALAGARAVINAVQFDGFPIENPRRGLTFERIDHCGTVALLAESKPAGVERFIYISGAAADESSRHPAFRAKGLAERAIRESGIDFTILRPSLVYGPEDRVLNAFANALRFVPVSAVPGTGMQKVQPVLVDDVAECVTLALGGRGRNGTYEIGGPELMTFDELIRLVMEITGRRRPIVHVPEAMMRTLGAIGEMMPRPMLSRDAIAFVTADNACNIEPLIREFGITLTPAREGMTYLARR